MAMHEVENQMIESRRGRYDAFDGKQGVGQDITNFVHPLLFIDQLIIQDGNDLGSSVDGGS
jgi:hypothetical protein